MRPDKCLKTMIARVQLFFVRAVTVFLLGGSLPAGAQDGEAPIVIGWTNAPPYLDSHGGTEPTGFFVDLAKLLAEELSRPIEIRRYPTVQDYFAAQKDGTTDIAAGVSRTPFLEETNFISRPVGLARVRFFGRVENSADQQPDTITGLRIGTLPPTVGTTALEILARNTEVPFPTVQEALFALLTGEIDGLLASQGTVLHLTRQAQIDHLIVPIGPPIHSVDRIVAVHQTRPDLVDPINAAIERLVSDGRLDALRREYLLEAVEPTPEVIRVAVMHNPPYGIVNSDGSFSGYSVDVFRRLAQRADLQFEFEEAAPAAYFAQPVDAVGDILPTIVIGANTPAAFDVTRPYEELELTAHVRADRRDALPPDLAGLRLAVKPDTAAFIAGAGFAAEELIVESSSEALVNALLEGDADVIIDVFGAVAAAAGELGLESEVRPAEIELPTVSLTFALRYGLGPIREILNANIPAFTLSQEYQELQATYLQPAQQWSPDPWLIAVAVAALTLIILLAGLLFQSARARQRADTLAAENRSVSGRLSAVLDAANSGIFGLSLDGRIVFANAGARHMLGGLNIDLPADWPENIRFLQSEDMQPLESSEDPVNRALAGQTIKGETSIMSRRGSSDPRYTRISSAPLSQDVSPDIGTVMIIDDVSEQEKNRQQVERSSRLDALGQLTGGIAPDFNNLLAAIKYSIQLSSVATDASKREEYTDIALKSVTRGATLTQRLLAFAKRQPGVAKSRRVEDVVKELEELMRPTIEEHISLEFIVDDPNLWVYVDVAQLENAMLNLVLNSRDAIMRSGRGNRIVIKARSVAEIEADLELRNESADTYIAQGLHAEHRTDVRRRDGKAYRYVEFSVTDNGPGMDDETKRRSIDPFFTTKETNSGTGLGLSMVYGFIQQADGEMRIYSEPDHGTTIRLLLPRGSTEGLREEPVERLPAPTGSGQVVLIAEDEPDLLRIMTDLVISLGYSVRMARNGTEGLDILKSNEPVDVLLTDIVMPGGVGGFALAEAARKERPGLPIIYMSGYTGISASEMGKVVAPLIQKPSPPYMLAEALEAALSKTRKPTSADA